MIAYDLRLVPKPFILACAMKVLSRSQSDQQDSKGAYQEITFHLLGSLFFKMIQDWFKKKNLLNELRKELQILSSFKPLKTDLDLSRQPVYVRTDLSFGLQSGGAVGHIAGVLNHLHLFTPNPIFLTSDFIPTVNSERECHQIFPGNDFWNFSELPSLRYNKIFFLEALQKIGKRIPSFIYQRYSLNNFSGAKLAQFYQVPFVLEFNGSEIWVSHHWGDKLKYEFLSEEIEMQNLRLANLIVVVSHPLKQWLIVKGIDPQKILVNPNGVDPDRYSPSIDASEIRKKLKLEGKTVLGFIGTFDQWHGAEVLADAYGQLLNAFPSLKDTLCLLMIGDGTTLPLARSILEKWKAPFISTGTVPQKEGPSYLAACDILVSPHVPNRDGSPFFGSPTKLFEYMAMGKGIVASNLDQIGDILKHNHSAWMVKPGDADSLRMGLKQLIDDPFLRKRLGEAARQTVVSQYTWKHHTSKIINKLIQLK